MHEFSLCEGIVKQVSIANNQRLDNVATINLTIGKLAGVDVESLLFWYPVVAKKFNCSAILHVDEPDGLVVCNQCSNRFTLINFYDPCPKCGAFADYEIVQGKELLVKSFELNFL
jgi:hydrogenase nickel incorporation protein HypA/HybF